MFDGYLQCRHQIFHPFLRLPLRRLALQRRQTVDLFRVEHRGRERNAPGQFDLLHQRFAIGTQYRTPILVPHLHIIIGFAEQDFCPALAFPDLRSHGLGLFVGTPARVLVVGHHHHKTVPAAIRPARYQIVGRFPVFPGLLPGRGSCPNPLNKLFRCVLIDVAHDSSFTQVKTGFTPVRMQSVFWTPK